MRATNASNANNSTFCTSMRKPDVKHCEEANGKTYGKNINSKQSVLVLEFDFTVGLTPTNSWIRCSHSFGKQTIELN